MAVAGPFSGKSGYVTVGGTEYSFGAWSIDGETDAPDVEVFTDGGFDDNIQGRSRAKLTLEAPATSALPLLSGTSYEFVLGIGDNGSDPALEIPVTARVTGYGVKVKAGEKNSPSMIEYKAKVRGTFALGIGS